MSTTPDATKPPGTPTTRDGSSSQPLYAPADDLLSDFDAMISVAWWAVGGTVLLGIAVHWAGLIAMNVPAICTLAIAFQVNSWLAIRIAHHSRRAIRVYFASHLVHVALTTVAIHFVGGIGFLPGALLYVLIIANGGIVGGHPAHVVALASTVAYAVLIALELTGTVTPVAEPGVPTIAVAPRFWPAMILFLGVVLQIEAAYAGRFAERLRVRRREIERYRAAIERETEQRYEARLRAERSERKRRAQSARYRTFAHIITHDLKSPINAIYLTTHHLLSDAGDRLDARSTAALEQIRHLAAGAEAKIFDLMQLYQVVSKPEAATWVDFGELVADVLVDLRAQIEDKGVTVDVGGMPKVWGQYEKLGYVVSNLLSNAVKFVPSQRGRIRVSGSVDAAGFTLLVDDNGVGIPVAYQRRIFELFAQAPPAEVLGGSVQPAGTGVGLALVKQVVRLHHGNVSVESLADGGSRFRVWLPAGGARPSTDGTTAGAAPSDAA